MKWILSIIKLFFQTIHVNVLIDLRLQTVKGYIDGIKILDVKNVGNEFNYKVWNFYFVLDKGFLCVFYKDKKIWETNKYENINILYKNKQLTINGFVIPLNF